jgi:glycosyltransferase involved in cell wall biosynthesis
MERLNFQKQPLLDSWDLAIHIARYGVVSQHCLGKRVLDIACGEGYGAYLMATHWGAMSVDAMDISDEALASAKTNFSDERIRWSKCDADKILPSDFDKKYDLIISLETIEHINNPKRFLEVLKQILAPNGLICVSCPNDGWYYGKGVTHNIFHKHVFSFEEFKQFSEEALGSASTFMIGSPSKGIATVPMNQLSEKQAYLDDRVKTTQIVKDFYFNPPQREAPSVEESLYFIGIWGLDNSKPIEASSSWSIVTPEINQHIQHIRPNSITPGKKPVAVLAADVPGWAYCNIAQNVKKYLSSSYDVQIVYLGNYAHWRDFYFDAFWEREASFVHIFWREFLYETLQLDIASEVSTHYGIDRNAFIQALGAASLTTSVYDHLHTEPTSMRERETLFALVDSYFVSSDKLLKIYCDGMGSAPDLVIEDGVDLDLFKPNNLSRFDILNRELVVGWAGNSGWCRNGDHDPKGFHSILLPALEILKKEGLNIRGEFADSTQKKRPRSEMVDYYNSIDLYVCTSLIEGTPNPVLESMACGVPIISTDVGIVPQVFGEQQKQYILKERSARALAEAIKTIYKNRNILSTLSKENLSQIQTWTWQHKMRGWLSLFTLAQSRKGSRSISRKKFIFSNAAMTAKGIQDLLESKTKQQHIINGMSAEIDRLNCQITHQNRIISSYANEISKLNYLKASNE